MNSVLLNAVLTGSSDYDVLFGALSWPDESSPQTERVEALTAFIEALGPLLDDDSGSSPVTSAKRRCIRDKIESIIWKKCLPLLCKMSAEAREGELCRESTAASCRLLSVCVRICGQDVSRRVALTVLPSLQLVEEGTTCPTRLGVEVASEVLSGLVSSLSSDEQFSISTVSSALSCIRQLPDQQVSRIISRVLVPLLSSCRRGVGFISVLRLILDDLCCWHATSRTPVVTERALLCLTALSDYLLTSHSLSPTSTVSCAPDPRLSAQFWMMIQDGLTHRDNLSRKRALYLLKRCTTMSEQAGSDCPPPPSDDQTLFKWSPSQSKVLREFWNDYVLVMETLEENQVHVVRPVLNRIDTLVQTTVNDNQGQGLFHPSWLLCVYQRMFHSENKSLMKEGVCHLLELQVIQQPAFASAFSQFIVGPFMDVLSETSLFNRSAGQNVGDCPELGVKLQVFMTTFFSSLPPEQRRCVLLQLIQHLGSKHWCAIPLLFVSQALSKLPPSPLLDNSGLIALREVLQSTMITHQVLLRGAAQCFLLNSALSLAVVGEVTLDDVFSFLMHFRADESLCRHTKLWDQVCVWLLENEGSFRPLTVDGNCSGAYAKKDSVKAYAENEIESYLRVPASTGQPERLPDSRKTSKLATIILLCVDMERSRQGLEISNTLESLLSPLLDTLSKLSTHIYLPLQKSDRSLQLVLSLLQLGAAPSCRRVGEEKGDSVLVVLQKLISKLADPIQAFIFRQLSGELQEFQLFDIERAQLYFSVLRQLVLIFNSTTHQYNEVQHSGFAKLIKHSLRVLREPSPQVPSLVRQVSKAITMASLATVCDLMDQKLINMEPESISDLKLLSCYFYSPETSVSQCQMSLGNINKTLLKPLTTDSSCDDLEKQGLLKQEWSRIAANFMRDQWICLNFLMKAVGIPEPARSSEGSETLKAVLSCSIEALSLLPSDLVLPVLTFMETVLPQLVRDDEALCVEAVTQSWQLVQGLSTNAHDFWPALKGFISMAFQQKLLQLTHAQTSTLLVTLKQIGVEIMELSQSKSGVFGVLIQHCCQTWLPVDGSGLPHDTVFASVFSHINIITEACTYGPLFRRDQRLVQDIHLYVEQLGEECAANVAVTSDNRDDQLPRVYVMAFLNRLDCSNSQHERLMEEVVMELLKKDNSISKSKVRYYSNSLQHRVKNRVWQTLLQLLPKLKKEFVATLLNSVYEAAFCANQASVKYLIEWMMILILVRYPQLIDSFWPCFNLDHDKTKTSICTFLSVLVHFNTILPNLLDKTEQLHKALNVILQSCFNHNFSVRLYALLALKRVWSLAEDQAAEEVDGMTLKGLSSVIRTCLNQAETMQSSGNANKNWLRIQEHFFFGAFHPVRDYSVETIFFTLPSLSELADDEWIPTWKFEKLSYFSETSSFPLRNPGSDLNQLQPGDWVQQDKSEQDKEERWAEVQKKISPWGLGIHEQELELQLVPPQRAARLGKLHGALLVVASLIDKPTNLGGLCRTCEIFGASALVLDSLRHIADKHFQSLSVSSELWLPLLEVKPMELADFLQTKKSEGYCIVGVEQTANSHSLQDYQFPEKTLLLLGNEREGIPANLLQMLDVCVEIPQQGIIRSLNVHVSAALLIWEYTRQHLCSGANINSTCS